MASVKDSVVTDPELVSGRWKPVLRLKARPRQCSEVRGVIRGLAG